MFKATHLWLIPMYKKPDEYDAGHHFGVYDYDEYPYLDIELEQIGPSLFRDETGIEFSFPPSLILRKGKLEKIV